MFHRIQDTLATVALFVPIAQFDRLMAELRIIAPAIGRSICLEAVSRRGWAR